VLIAEDLLLLVTDEASADYVFLLVNSMPDWAAPTSSSSRS
jgi:hypothetical protein